MFMKIRSEDIRLFVFEECCAVSRFDYVQCTRAPVNVHSKISLDDPKNTQELNRKGEKKHVHT